MAVVLQTAGEEISHKQDDLIVKITGVALLDRGVIFINDDNRCNLMMLMEHSGQGQHGAGEFHIACCPLHNAAEGCLVHIVASFRCEQLCMPGKFAADDLGQLLERFLPCLTFDILEAEEDYGVFPLIGPIFLSLLPDRLIPEIDRGILVGFLKEGSQHVHVQGFAKAPRAGKQCHLRPLIQEILDHQGLVHIVVFR